MRDVRKAGRECCPRSTAGGSVRLATDIRAKDVEDFKAALAESRSVATVNQNLKLLRAIFHRAIRQERLAYNPVTAIKLFQEHNARNRCLSREEEARLLEALPAAPDRQASGP